ncbi:MAG: hypothetical protein IPI60_05110 [Saprospiraceae bacterium]|nr:hypothetical protein [Saprospiraceae bacterium]
MKTQFKTSFVMCLLALIVSFAINISFSQSYEDLKQLTGYQTKTYYSSGAEEKAMRIAGQFDKVHAYYKSRVKFTPEVTLLILSPGDWSNHTGFPVYGMPHYLGNKTLIVASEDNDFWKSFVPPLDKLPAEFAKQIRETYTGKDDQLSMEPFFDLLAIHELGHAYHMQADLKMQRQWMAELFVNIFLHVYIAENEPELLPALTVFPKMVVYNTDPADLKYISLQDLDTYYNELGQKYPRNYGWYQCRWHMASDNIYESSNVKGFIKLWDALKTERTLLNDTELADMLNKKVHFSVANVMEKWDGK